MSLEVSFVSFCFALFALLPAFLYRKCICKGHSLNSRFQVISAQVASRKIMTILVNGTNLIRNYCKGINMEPWNLICPVSFHLCIHPLRSHHHQSRDCRPNHLVVGKLRVIKNPRLKPSLISRQCEVTGRLVPKNFLVCRRWNAKWNQKRF